MKIGDLVKHKEYPKFGTGIIIKLCAMDPGYQGRYSGCLAVFGEQGLKFIRRDFAEVLNEAR